MTAFTCAKCYRRFTPTVEALQAALAAAQGQKHALVMCPHCGKGNKTALERIRQALRFVPQPVAAQGVPTVPGNSGEMNDNAPEKEADS